MATLGGSLGSQLLLFESAPTAFLSASTGHMVVQPSPYCGGLRFSARGFLTYSAHDQVLHLAFTSKTTFRKFYEQCRVSNITETVVDISDVC